MRNLSKLPMVNREKDIYKTVFNYIERNPIFSIRDIQDESHLSFNTVNTAVSKLEELGIVRKQVEVKRNKVYMYGEYLEFFASVK